MAKAGPACPPVFRAKAGELATPCGKGVPRLARDLGVSERALRQANAIAGCRPPGS